ncbi:MAG: hypothetical protein KC615_00330 [Anaerolineae bacterium]|nr:hypothetical protein [Anaerolineae bacterium]MCB9458675.1 hypothetical protein [Anaerolineaceae bacterium]
MQSGNFPDQPSSQISLADTPPTAFTKHEIEMMLLRVFNVVDTLSLGLPTNAIGPIEKLISDLPETLQKHKKTNVL